ncbi:hypothetical protein FACS189437_09870 [Bacteroidia bacterium]|nr:hypothetical protein FACS189437_09870 [Bacteroidia bacterium]
MGIPSFGSAWYLSKIEIPNSNDTITFNYSSNKEDKQKSSVSTNVDTAWYWANGKWNSTTSECRSLGTSVFLSDISHRYLSSITGPNFTLTFFTSNAGDKRHDYDVNNPGWQKLDSISLKNKSNEVVKRFHFTYDTGTNTRLYLGSVGEPGTPAYEFRYNNGGGVINYDIPAQDHWGYYNGVRYDEVNTYRIPLSFKVAGDDVEYLTVNRETDPDAVKIGILNQIKYPTGGTTDFEFEVNDYSQYCQWQISNINLLNGKKSWSKWKIKTGTEITIPYKAYVIVEIEESKLNEWLSDKSISIVHSKEIPQV